jgi:two-component system response regulator AtoC
MLDINFKNEEIMVPPLIGTSKSIERIRELIDHTADTGLNVLITGKSGVGKEVVAQNLYYKSERKNKPFIKVNCAALPEGLLESELFGFERGAFTGAERKKRGKFELAHQGVIFLDEIGDMSLSLQSKLLHVLQGGEFAPLGSEKEVTSDAWVIAATNQELEKKVKERLFREDLYYRLSTIKIHIPLLRNRPEDIPPLIDYFIERYASQFDRKKISKPDSDAMEKLITYSWPGNVRELQSILKSSMVMGNWEEVVDDLSIKDKHNVNSTSDQKGLDKALNVDILLDLIKENSPGHATFSLKKIRKETMNIIDKKVISHVLNQTGWNRTKASKILKISYKTILYKMSDLDIKPSTPNR